MENKKIVKTQVLDVHELTALTECFIIATALNTRQAQAVADEIEDLLAEEGRMVLRKEGYDTARWILLDYGEIIVHILCEEDADFYSLDRLWQDAKQIKIEEEVSL